MSSLLGSSDNVREVVASIHATAATALTRPGMARPLVEGGMPAAVLDTCSRSLPNAVRVEKAAEVCAAFDASMAALGSPLQLSSQICSGDTLPKLIREVELSLAEGVAGGTASGGGSSIARRKGKSRDGMELPHDPLPPAAASSFALALSYARENLLMSIADTLVRAARSVPSDDAAAAAELHRLVSSCCASGLFACAVTAASAVGTGTTSAAPLAGKLAAACEALARSSGYATESLLAMGLPPALARALAHPGLQEGALADAWCSMARAFVQLHSEAGVAASAAVHAAMDAHAHAADDTGAEAAEAVSPATDSAAAAPASAAAAPTRRPTSISFPVPLPYPLPAEAVRLPDAAAYHINGWDGGGRRMVTVSLVLLRLLARSGDEPTRRAVERVVRKCRGRSAASPAGDAAVIAEAADDVASVAAASDATAAGKPGKRKSKAGDRYGSEEGKDEDSPKALGPLLIAAGSPLCTVASLRPIIDDIVAAMQALPPPAAAAPAIPTVKGKEAKQLVAAAAVGAGSGPGSGRSKARTRSQSGAAAETEALASTGPERAARTAAAASAAPVLPPAKARPMPIAAAIKAAAAAVVSPAALAGPTTKQMIAAAASAAGLPQTSRAGKGEPAAKPAAKAKPPAKAPAKAQPPPKKEEPRRYPKGKSKRARPRGADAARTIKRAASAAAAGAATPRAAGGAPAPARTGGQPKKA